MAARWAHNPKVDSSSLSPATKRNPVIEAFTGFVFSKNISNGTIFEGLQKLAKRLPSK